MLKRKTAKKPESYTCSHCHEVKEGTPRAAIINGFPFPQFCSLEHMEAYEAAEKESKNA
ncbi:hypothetical protein KW791_00205 [Candidatus Parcubacteria bacterium]|nr:hypothetical protein [Candidatus Parcubacteria bacterium]